MTGHKQKTDRRKDNQKILRQELHQEFTDCVSDLLLHEKVTMMDRYIHHNSVTTLEHTLSVAFLSYRISRRLRLDSRSVARGALLHDMYLYDWHVTRPPEGLHGFTHPGIAYRNARDSFCLNDIEADIILKHMWPMTIILPRYAESLLVCLVDKYCALLEVLNYRRQTRLRQLKFAVAALTSEADHLQTF